MDELLPLDCELFKLTGPGAAHWLAMDGWTLEEAALLLCGANPKCISEFDADPDVLKADFASAGYIGMLDRLRRAGEMGVLSFPAEPAAIIRWAASKHGVPPVLQALASAAWPSKSEQAPQASDEKQATPMKGVKGQGKVWTDEYKAEVRAYRNVHGLKRTAEFYEVSQTTISKHVPAAREEKPLGYSVFSHRTK